MELWTLPCVVIKTGDEPAILSLKEEMMRRVEVGAIPVESAPENEAKLFKGMLRARLLALECKLKNILGQHSVVILFVECVADILTKCMQGADGPAGCERLFGKQVHVKKVWSLESESGGTSIILLK